MIVRSYFCQHGECKQPFQTSRHAARFCSNACKSAEAYSKRKAAKIKRRKVRMPSTGFYAWLLREVRRAGTVEVLTGLTSSDLAELLKLRRECNKAAGFEAGKVRTGSYELSHICPVHGTALLGLLHPQNLVITTVNYNRTRANRYSGGGKYIEKSKLDEKWKISEDHTDTNIYNLIQKFLGSELNEFLSSHVLTLTQRQTLINKLAKKLAGDDEDVESIKEKLKFYKNEDLAQLAEQNEIKAPEYNKESRKEFNVAFDEMVRFESYGVSINPALRLYVDYLHQQKENKYRFDSVANAFFLQVHNSDERFWDVENIYDFLSLQVVRELHKEKSEWVFAGKLLQDCFTLPEFSAVELVPSHPLEEYLVNAKGPVPVYCTLNSYYARIDAKLQQSSSDDCAARVAIMATSVLKFLGQLEEFDEIYEWQHYELSEYDRHYCALPEYQIAFNWLDDLAVPF